MAIITKPTVSKGSAATFQLNLAELLLNTAITDAYFKVVDNLSKVIVSYKSDEGNQRVRVVFPIPDGQNPATLINGTFEASQFARDDFQVDNLMLVDEDGDAFTLQREDLVVADFDLSLTGGGSSIPTTAAVAFVGPEEGRLQVWINGHSSADDPADGEVVPGEERQFNATPGQQVTVQYFTNSDRVPLSWERDGDVTPFAQGNNGFSFIAPAAGEYVGIRVNLV